MNVMIGVDPHKASHTAVAIGRDEDQIASVKVRATSRQVEQLLWWATHVGLFLRSDQGVHLSIDPGLHHGRRGVPRVHSGIS